MRFGRSALFSLLVAVVATSSNHVLASEQTALRGDSERRNQDRELADEPTAIELMAGEDAKKNGGTRRVIVRYKDGHKKNTFYAMKDASLQRASGEPEIKVEFDFEELNAYVVTAMPAEIAILESNPDIESIEDDPIRTPMHMARGNGDMRDFFGDRRLAEDMPYGIGLVQAPELWEKGITGEGIKVCVIDTGIDQDHPDFVTAKLDGVDNSDGLEWKKDECGHGTHVSGTVAAKKDDKGVVGVAPDAEIFTVRVFGPDCGYVYASGIYDAALRCKEGGARIVSMSLGGPEYSSMEDDAFEKLFNDEDVLVVAAAGNSGNTDKSYPASYGSVMSVAAVRENKQHANFSQRNDQVDIAAPGVGVLSTFPVGGCRICGFWNRRGYGKTDGTSMATPHVSGVAALILSAAPNTGAVELRNILEASAEDLGDEGRDDRYGYGLVAAKAALDMLDGGETEEGNTDGGVKPPAPIEGCSDIANWFDADGEEYNCEWYSQGTRCSEFGNRFANNGNTAQDACCSCGGGLDKPSDPVGVCRDSPQGWHDSFSSFYDCNWYAEGVNCDRFGDSFANDGRTAKQSCCACGGGSVE